MMSSIFDGYFSRFFCYYLVKKNIASIRRNQFTEWIHIYRFNRYKSRLLWTKKMRKQTKAHYSSMSDHQIKYQTCASYTNANTYKVIKVDKLCSSIDREPTCIIWPLFVILAELKGRKRTKERKQTEAKYELIVFQHFLWRGCSAKRNLSEYKL